jgi:hypothetical protein
MTRVVPPFARSVAITAALLLVVALPGSADAARARTTSSTTGNDISWPQCGGAFPSGQAFGIVGINDGLANTLNPCLGPTKGGAVSTSELFWALQSNGNSAPGKLPTAALYVNTANPGPGVADWPTSTVSNGSTVSCVGEDTPACAWQYGWNRAVQDMDWLIQATTNVQALTKVVIPTSPAGYPWWLDVETGNSWETGTTAGLANDVADLQGMVAAFEANGVTVGIYSTSYQWGQITGGSQAGNLAGLADWIPGARRLSGAQSNCSLPSFTGGTVRITQWFGSPYDGDYAC